MISMRCKTCGGILDVDDGHEVLFCPYCGGKELLEESDAVKIERIKAKTELEKQKQKYKKEDNDAKKTIIICAGLLIFGILCFVIALIAAAM